MTCNIWGILFNHPLQIPNSGDLPHLMKFCIISTKRPMTSVKYTLLRIGMPHNDLTPNMLYRFKSVFRGFTKYTCHFVKILRTKQLTRFIKHKCIYA